MSLSRIPTSLDDGMDVLQGAFSEDNQLLWLSLSPKTSHAMRRLLTSMNPEPSFLSSTCSLTVPAGVARCVTHPSPQTRWPACNLRVLASLQRNINMLGPETLGSYTAQVAQELIGDDQSSSFKYSGGTSIFRAHFHGCPLHITIYVEAFLVFLNRRTFQTMFRNQGPPYSSTSTVCLPVALLRSYETVSLNIPMIYRSTIDVGAKHLRSF